MEFVGVFLVFLSVLSVVVLAMGLLFLQLCWSCITPTFDKEFIINDAFAKMPLLSLRLFIADGEQSTAFHRDWPLHHAKASTP